MIDLIPYSDDLHSRWDAFVGASRNGTFLFRRGYMDYHRDRFEDASLVAVDGSEWLAVLPAHRKGDCLASHLGLTYGGWIVGAKMGAPQMEQLFEALEVRLRQDQIGSFIYKPIPFFYARAPSQEDLFSLHRRSARLLRRDVLSVLDSRCPLPMQSRRLRGAKKAERLAVEIIRDDAALPAYWAMLEHNLLERHEARPVHSLEEMTLLQKQFPQNIQLFVARKDGRTLAGVLVYETETAARTQYISSTSEGRSCGALDLLLTQLVTKTFREKPYLDLGSSMEEPGRLDVGLVEQKEGFGARTVALDTWEWQLAVSD